MASCWPEESLWYYPNMVFNPRRHFTHLAWRYSWIYISYIATTTKKGSILATLQRQPKNRLLTN
jgi:hypothetical protein